MGRIGRAWAKPGEAWTVLVALARGWLLKARYGLGRGRVSIGPDFRAYCWLRVRGPGTVTLGRKVSVGRGFQRKPAILTHHVDAVVAVGDETFLGGTRISCTSSVTIGEANLFGSVTVVDADVIPPPPGRPGGDPPPSAGGPIEIGSRCWLGTNAFVLRDTVLGDECVLAAGAVVREKTVESGVLLVGNPARPLGSTRR